ncbi:hypothetical protein HGM15179_007252, partial [Zosterops borbonicus]
STIIRLNLALTDFTQFFWEFMCNSILFLICFSAFCYMMMVYTMKFSHVEKKGWAAVACTNIWLMSSCPNLTSSENLDLLLSSCCNLLMKAQVNYSCVHSAVTWRINPLCLLCLSATGSTQHAGNLLLYVMVGDNFQQAMLSPSRCKWRKYIQ